MQLYSVTLVKFPLSIGGHFGGHYFHRRQSIPTYVHKILVFSVRLEDSFVCQQISSYNYQAILNSLMTLWCIFTNFNFKACNWEDALPELWSSSLLGCLCSNLFPSSSWVSSLCSTQRQIFLVVSGGTINIPLNQKRPQGWRGAISFHIGTPPPPPSKAPTKSPLQLPTACHTLKAMESHPRVVGRPSRDCHFD